MTNTALMAHVFLQLACILGTCWAVNLVLRRLGQTRVVADMVAGFLLGPSLFGLVLPDVQRWFFPLTLVVPNSTPGAPGVTVTHPALTALYVLGQVGLVLYMFLAGLSFDPRRLAGHVRSSVTVSLTGMIVPLVAGGAVGWWLAGDSTFFPAGVAPWQAALFVGCAIAVVAFPMLARIIQDSGLAGTRLGTLALSCAAIDDAIAWILLALVVATVGDNPFSIVVAVGGIIVYVLVMVGPVRLACARLLGRAARDGAPKREVLVVASILVLLGASFTDAIGVYSVFGAFLAGTVIPASAVTTAIRGWMEPLTTSVLLPMFFTYSGLRAQLSLLADPHVILVTVVIVVVAFAAKGGACFVACRLSGISMHDSVSLAALLNARGLMELILLDIGRGAGIITPQLYTVLTVMTIVTTLAASPLYLWARRYWPDAAVAEIAAPEIARSEVVGRSTIAG